MTNTKIKLPLDCEVLYYRDFLTCAESEALFEAIQACCDLSDQVVHVGDGQVYSLRFGKCIFGDASFIESAQSTDPFGQCKLWIPELQELKAKVESVAGRSYGICVCIHYKNGESGCDYHHDPAAYGDVSSIASISLGEERMFSLRRADDHDDKYDLRLGNGSLLIMGEHCQDRYEHALLVEPQLHRPRINLTFRALGWSEG